MLNDDPFEDEAEAVDEVELVRDGVVGGGRGLRGGVDITESKRREGRERREL